MGMIAARYAEHGGPEVLQLVEVDDPVAAPDEVVVAVRAAGINPADVKQRHSPATALPSGTGREFAGVVVAVGAAVDRFVVGDEVFGTGEQVIGQRVAAPQHLVARKPDGLPWTWAASIPVAVQTAAVAVASQHPGPTDTVLVSAAAGGVGHIAAQLAVRAGARVLGTASERNHALLRSFGVEPIAYGDGMLDRLRAAAPDGIDIVLDHQGAETVEAALALGVPRARINTIAGVAERFGVPHVGRRGLDLPLVTRLADQLVAGDLRLLIEAEYPLSRIVDAYRHLERGHLAGKVVLTLP